MVSVIIPVYNTRDYLRRCVGSAAGQTFTELEIILVDDGSTDGSGKICDEYAAADERVRVVHQTNSGASIARRKGLEMATGECVTFVDSDDILEPDYIERLYDALTRHDVGIAACDYIKHREGKTPGVKHDGETQVLDYETILSGFFHYEFWGLWGKIYKKSVFEEIYFPEATVNEDYTVMAQLFYKCRKMAYIPDQLYHYMIHEGSLSNQKFSKRMMEEWTNKKWVYDFYKNNDPEWLPHAEAQAVETCCKLIGSIGKNKDYRTEKKDMQIFLRRHIMSILRNPEQARGIKYLALIRMIH